MVRQPAGQDFEKFVHTMKNETVASWLQIAKYLRQKLMSLIRWSKSHMFLAYTFYPIFVVILKSKNMQKRQKIQFPLVLSFGTNFGNTPIFSWSVTVGLADRQTTLSLYRRCSAAPKNIFKPHGLLGLAARVPLLAPLPKLISGVTDRIFNWITNSQLLASTTSAFCLMRCHNFPFRLY